MIYKLKNINCYLVNVPSALAGLALGISSLGFAWEKMGLLQGSAQMIGSIVASSLLLLVFLKFLFNPHLWKLDLQHHIGGSVAPTIAMTLMVVANTLSLYYFQLGQAISLLAIVFHFYLLAMFIFYRIKNLKFEHILPSWFIPPIGGVLALIMYPGGISKIFAVLILQFGLFAYALLLPVVLYRLLFLKKLYAHEKPLLIILATPASLLLLGYLDTIIQPSYLLITLLISLALVMTFFAYFAFIKLLRLPFTPAYSAFTFPLVVGASALFKTSQFLLAQGIVLRVVDAFEVLAFLELAVATLMLIYVSIRYIGYLWQINHPSSIRGC